MEEDITSLVELASRTSANTKAAVKVIQDILNGSKTQDPMLENLHIDLSYFADACDFLSVQLSNAGGLDSFVAVEMQERFWKSTRNVLELWLKNSEQNLTTMQRDRKLRAEWMGWLVARHDASPRPTSFNLNFAMVGATMKAHMQDAQMIIALFNI